MNEWKTPDSFWAENNRIVCDFFHRRIVRKYKKRKARIINPNSQLCYMMIEGDDEFNEQNYMPRRDDL